MSEIHAAVGSYVVHALDDAELNDFEAHLAVCETCRREVVEFSDTAAHLGQLAETAPPPALRASILSAIAEVRPLPPELPEAAPEVPAAPPRAVPARRAAEDEPTARPVVDELALRRQRRSTRILALAVAAALVAALGLGGWAVNLRQERQAQVAEASLETQLYTAPDVKVYTDNVNGSPVSYVVSKSLNKALFVGRNLPDPGAAKAYQLWTLTDGGAVPNNMVDGSRTTKTWFSGDVKGATGMAVTVEPRGGSSVPTKPILAQQAF